MQLKKKIVSFALAAALLVSVPVSAFASPAFNAQVLNGRNDITINIDDMTDVIYLNPSSLYDGSMLVRPTAYTAILIDPHISLTDAFDFFDLSFSYHGYNLANLNMIAVKIGDNRYLFSKCRVSSSVDDTDGTIYENISFTVKNEILPFMNDFVSHKDSEIKVRLIGNSSSFEFVLTDTMKRDICDMYNLYVSGGGLSQPDFHLLSYATETTVTRNGVALS